MYNPVSTYRIQFNRQFTFGDAEALIDYFEKLGIGTLYASPVLEAVPGSVHGYDGINPHKINREIGDRESLIRLSRALQQKNIGWLQDIVPNHMAYDPRNIWLADVLEKSRFSSFAGFFDIRWNENKPLMAPFLGDETEACVRNGDIKLIFDKGRLRLRVYDKKFPVTPAVYPEIFDQAAVNLPEEIMEIFTGIPELTGNYMNSGTWDNILNKFAEIDELKKPAGFINSCIKIINRSPEKLLEIVNAQPYRLCYWELTNSEINYRRFFTVNGLICLNIQDNEVFDSFHREIINLVQKEVFRGLRVDHIDGLYDPAGYLEKLRGITGKDTYIVVEKILGFDEIIPEEWPVQGATGYSFLATVNNLFTRNESEYGFTHYYEKITGNKSGIDNLIRDRKAFILFHRMRGELENLYNDFIAALNSDSIPYSQIGNGVIKDGIAAILIVCPVYRYYTRKMPLGAEEEKLLRALLQKVVDFKSSLQRVMEFFTEVIIKRPKKNHASFNENILHFYRRLMQLAGPLMAKGVEDTLMYSYNRFIGHNEVGDTLDVFGLNADGWHAKMLERFKLHPMTMNTTSTHDTKRGEDVRARLNVLTDLPELWFGQVENYRNLNKMYLTGNAPDSNDEYFIYLTLHGFYPMPGIPDPGIHDRLMNYLIKAIREAKQHGSWSQPDDQYELAVNEFIKVLLDKDKVFFKKFSDFHNTVADFGIINSLSQLILKCTSPGVPDIYQGTELWDLSLVDPDNRRQVDFRKRKLWLMEIRELFNSRPGQLLNDLWQQRYNGKIKLLLTWLLLNYRKENSDLFLYGDYVQLRPAGRYKNNILAFIRAHKNKWLLTAIPMHLAELCRGNEKNIQAFNWEDTYIEMPQHSPATLHNILNKKPIPVKQKRLPVKDIFPQLPVAVMAGLF